VPRFWIWVACYVGFWMTATGWGSVSAQAIGQSETLLPGTTQGFFAITNVDQLKEHWNATQLGHLMADPVMEPFTKDIRRQFENRWSAVHDRLGLTLDDMKGVPGGALAIALVGPAPGKAALAIVVDVSGKHAETKEMLEKVSAAQRNRGARESQRRVKGCPDPIIQFDLPEPEEEKEAVRSTLRGSAKSEAEKLAAQNAGEVPMPTPASQRQAFYCWTGDLLVVSDDFDVLAGILSRAMGHGGDSLADQPGFQAVMARCKADYGEKVVPQARWFIHPLGYAEAARASTPPSKRRKGKSILEVMRNQGVAAVQGIGGFIDFSSEGFEWVHRTAVHAPPPYEKAMKMLVLPNADDFAPQPWVPRDIATYTTLYFDIGNAFDHFGPLFEEIVAQGEQGAWQDTLDHLEKTPDGPKINLREELIAHLGRRITMLTDYQTPITTASERLLFAIELTNEEAAAKGVEKLLKNNPDFKQPPRVINGHVVWEYAEEEAAMPDPVQITFDAAPTIAPYRAPQKHAKKSEDGLDEEEEEEPEDHPLLPHAAVTVWKGHLLVASHIDFLLKVIDPAGAPDKLNNDVDYVLVGEQIEKFRTKEKCVRVFSRTDEEYYPTYELIRQNKLPQSETMLARLLNGLFGPGKKGAVRPQKIDGSQLPDYQVVRRHLGPAGLQATSEPTGWYLKGFTLAK